jgi:hypothetical protein
MAVSGVHFEKKAPTGGDILIGVVHLSALAAFAFFSGVGSQPGA